MFKVFLLHVVILMLQTNSKGNTLTSFYSPFLCDLPQTQRQSHFTDLQGKVFHLSFHVVFPPYYRHCRMSYCQICVSLEALFKILSSSTEFVNCPQLLSLSIHVQDLQILLNSFISCISYEFHLINISPRLCIFFFN